VIFYSLLTPITILVLGVGFDINSDDNKELSYVSQSISVGAFFFIGYILWRKTFLTPFDWKRNEVLIISSLFIISILIQALTASSQK